LIPKHPDDDRLYDLRATIREALGDHEHAGADREKTAALRPKDWHTVNAQAWKYATGPITERDPELAVALARRAIALAPGQPTVLNTLGVALYRAGQYTEAIAVLEQSLAAGKGRFDADDLIFLAMAHHRLNHRAEARDRFDRAIKWLATAKARPGDSLGALARFRTEAEAVLASPTGELPIDVFAPPSP
jgi:tetratricopeptide (TPR) repeat protein